MYTRLIFYILLTMSPFILGAQVSSNPSDQIKALKDGVLIVRLDMKNNVKKAYQDMLENMDRNDSQYSRVKEKLDSLNVQRVRYKQNVQDAMNKHYAFSDFCLIENQNMDFFLSGDESILECHDGISPGDRNYFYLIKGDRDSHWIVADPEFTQLSTPFPSSHDLGIKKFFDFLLGRNNFSSDNMSKVIEKMNERFEKYYQKVK